MAKSIDIKLKFNSADFKRLGKNISKNVIQDGLDEFLNKELKNIKSELISELQRDIRIPTIDTKNTNEQLTIDNTISLSQNEVFKHIFGIDIAELSKEYKQYNNYITINDKQFNVFFAAEFEASSFNKSRYGRTQEYVVRSRMPISKSDDFDVQYSLISEGFRNGIFVRMENGYPQVYLNPGIDLSIYQKIECSTTSGKTADARRKFESYKYSDKRKKWEKYLNSERYVEWSINKKGMDIIFNEGINLNSVVDDFMNGELDKVELTLNQMFGKKLPVINKIKSKLNELKTGINTPDLVSQYYNIIQQINSLKWVKKITGNQVTYQLSLNFDSITTENVIESIISFASFSQVQLKDDALMVLEQKLAKILKSKRK